MSCEGWKTIGLINLISIGMGCILHTNFLVTQKVAKKHYKIPNNWVSNVFHCDTQRSCY